MDADTSSPGDESDDFVAGNGVAAFREPYHEVFVAAHQNSGHFLTGETVDDP